MSVSKYEAFVACAEGCSFTRAAERLGYTQSAVSQLIHSLETELGLSLLSRKNHSVELTEEGKVLLPYVKGILAAKKDFNEKAAELSSLHTGKVAIGAISSIALRKLPDVIRRFQSKYPGIEVTVKGSSYSEIENDLSEKMIDIGFVSGESLKEFKTFPYVRDRLMLVMPDRGTGRRKKLLGRTYLPPQELSQYEFILPAEGANYDIGSLFARYNLSPTIRFRMEDDYAALELVRQGFGVTILPELLLEAYEAKDIIALPILNTERQIFIAINSSRVISAAAEAMLLMLQEDSSLY